jgi:DNA polymerase III sliding clamp (beta) subunit (PCNA family)
MLTGVCLDFDGAVLTMAATDRYRLAVRELPWQPATDGLRAAALVPARTLAEAARTMTAGTPVTIAFGGEAAEGEPRPAEGMISFDDGTRRLTVRLIAGEFIRYQSRFPAEFGCRAEVPAAAFTEAVRRVSLVAERATPVRLTFGGGAVIIEAQAEGRARATERVRADFDGSEPAIAFNPHYLLDGLIAAAAPHARAGQPADGEEPASPAEMAGRVAGGRVRIEFTSPAKPALITWAGPEEADAGPAPKKAAGKKAPAKKAAAKGAAVKQAAAIPADGPAAASAEPPSAQPAVAATEPGPSGPPGSFRYLVVPLRAPSRA